MLNVLLIDDHAVVRDGVRAALAVAVPLGDVVEAPTAREGLAQARQRAFDVVVLDLTLPDMNGIEALKALHGAHPRLPVVVFSMHTDREYCVRCLRAGARAYVTKDSPADEIGRAVSAATAGRRYVSRPLADELVGALLDIDDGPPHQALSDREFEVLCLLGSGKAVSDVATMLCLSVKTVSTYRTRLLEKLALENNAQIIRYVLEHKLLP